MTFCDLQWVVEDDVEKSSWASTQVKFEKFVVTLKGEGEKALADLIRKVMTNQYDSCFRESASSGIGFAHEFLPGEGGDGDEEQSLRQCVLTFRRTLRDVPVPTSKLPDIGDDFVVPGDVDEECSVEIRKFVTAERKKLISFPWVDHGSDKTWKPGGSANAVLQKSHFIKSRGEPGRDHSLILLMPELWPARTSFTDPNAHKAPVRVSKELEEAAKWCTTAKNDNTVVVFGDGRDRKMRKIFENRVDETVGDDQKHLQVSLVYAMPPRGDIRFPKRKTFGSTVNLEILTVNLPVARVRISSKPRDHFSACGEDSTHALSYTGVPIRRIARLPRLALDGKESIIGTSLPTYPEDVVAAIGRLGHPLFWGEVKEVETYVALFKDFSAESILDVTPGSGAAAMAAAILGIHYEGLAMNASHANWLDRIVEKAMYAIIIDSKDERFKPIKAELGQYFSEQVAEARLFLTSDQYEKKQSDEDEDHEDA